MTTETPTAAPKALTSARGAAVGLTALGACVGLLTGQTGLTWGITGATLAAALWVSIIDLRTKQIPSHIIWPTFAFVVALTLTGSLSTPHTLATAAIGSAVVFAVSLIWALISGLGGGDVKLMTLLGWTVAAVTGSWVAPLYVLAGGYLLGAVPAVVIWIITRDAKRQMAFGVYFTFSAVIVGLVLR